MSVGWTNLVHKDLVSEAGSSKVSFDISTPRLAL